MGKIMATHLTRSIISLPFIRKIFAIGASDKVSPSANEYNDYCHINDGYSTISGIRETATMASVVVALPGVEGLYPLSGLPTQHRSPLGEVDTLKLY
jgi:hypothetical protein